MPVEFSRTTKNKKVRLPSGATVNVPVITEISFIDKVSRSQETHYTVDNSAKSNRTVHVDSVSGSDGGGDMQVERIDQWNVLDKTDRGQETDIKFDNKTKGDPPPPYFPTHKKTHIVRYGDDSAWVKSELIDEFVVVDKVDRGQETHYTLKNPVNDPNTGSVPVDPNDPDITDSGNDIDPPWRTDPFQNIVDFSSVYFIFSFAFTMYGTQGGETPCDPVDLSPPSGNVAATTLQLSYILQGLNPGEIIYHGAHVHVDGMPSIPGPYDAGGSDLGLGLSQTNPSIGGGIDPPDTGVAGLFLNPSAPGTIPTQWQSQFNAMPGTHTMGLSTGFDIRNYQFDNSFCSAQTGPPRHVTEYLSSSPATIVASGSLNFAGTSVSYHGLTYTPIPAMKYSTFQTTGLISTSFYSFEIMFVPPG